MGDRPTRRATTERLVPVDREGLLEEGNAARFAGRRRRRQRVNNTPIIRTLDLARKRERQRRTSRKALNLCDVGLTATTKCEEIKKISSASSIFEAQPPDSASLDTLLSPPPPPTCAQLCTDESRAAVGIRAEDAGGAVVGTWPAPE